MSLPETFIGWLAPVNCVICNREGTSLCELCETGELLAYGERCGLCGILSPGCRTCMRCRRGAPSHIWISTDYDGPAQKLIQLYKFTHQRSAGVDIARTMSATFNYFVQNPPGYLVVPVPTASSRVRQRGFDHAARLAKLTAANLGMDYSSALSRLGQSRQLGAKRALRLSQTASSYYALRPEKIAGQKILLIDDVITTGATLKACTRALRTAGARRVDALVFAKKL